MEGLKRGAAAIVGAAESDLGQVADGMSPIDLMRAGHFARARRLRARHERRRRAVLRHDAAAHVDRVADRISRHRAEVHRLVDDRRLVVRVSRRASGGCDSGRPLQRGGDRLRLARSAASGANRLRRARSIRTRRRSSHSCRPAPTRWQPRATCISSAPRASSSPRSRWPRANGRSSIPPRGRRSRSASRTC